MSSILLVEDEPRIATFVKKGLAAAGFSATVVVDGISALEHLATGSFELLILDVGLPGIDGFEVLRRLRERGDILPVIMLTARSSVRETVAGLDGGANDYLSKPFKFDELLARVRLRLREVSRQLPTGAIVRHGDIALDLTKRRVTAGTRTSDLSAREFALLEHFLHHPEQVLSREQLLSSVWGFDFDPGSNVVDVYVRYLRAKIGPDHIETVRGMGYRLV